MTSKKLVSLTITAVVLVGLAVLSSSRTKVNAPARTGLPVLDHLDLSAISAIEAELPGGKQFSLTSTDSGWVVKSMFGYPADMVKIRKNLVTLQSLKIGQVVKGKKLKDPVFVDLQNAEGKSVAALCLGETHVKKASGEMASFGGGGYPDGRYLAVAGEEQEVVLVNETLEPFDGEIRNWVDTRVAVVPSSEIDSINLSRNGTGIKLLQTNGTWTVEGIASDEEFDTTKSYGVTSALGSLDFNAVADPALSEEALGMTTGMVYTAITKTGESYTVRVGKTVDNGTDRYLKIKASVSSSGTNSVENAAVKKRVDEFNDKTAKWTYVVSSYVVDNLSGQRSDFVKKKETTKLKPDGDTSRAK